MNSRSCWQCSVSMKSSEKRKLCQSALLWDRYLKGFFFPFSFPPILFPQLVFSFTNSSPPRRATSAVIENTPNVMSARPPLNSYSIPIKSLNHCRHVDLSSAGVTNSPNCRRCKDCQSQSAPPVISSPRNVKLSLGLNFWSRSRIETSCVQAELEHAEQFQWAAHESKVEFFSPPKKLYVPKVALCMFVDK